jgi:hypothetical protein
MEGGISRCEIDNHVHVAILCLLTTGKRAEDADFCHTGLRADGRGCCFDLFKTIFFLRCGAPDIADSSLSRVMRLRKIRVLLYFSRLWQLLLRISHSLNPMIVFPN